MNKWVIGFCVILLFFLGGAFLLWVHRTSSLSLVDNKEVHTSPSLDPTSTPLVVGDFQKNVTAYCGPDTVLFDQVDTYYCQSSPKLDRFRLFEINLTDNRILFYENGVLGRTFPVAYQAPYGAWFQTPTGYFTVGAKKQKFLSSIVPVFMENAVQMYEDFFIHNIPYYRDGTKVTSQFSGGCLRLEDDIAKDFFDLVQSGDSVVSYTTLTNLTVRSGFASPVQKDSFWIRQRFNSPLKVQWKWSADKRDDYIQHAGLDLAPTSNASDHGVYSIGSGVIDRIIHNGQDDAGLGNGVIIKHFFNGSIIYSLYGHLASVSESLSVGQSIATGTSIGIVGNTGYGCSYWHVGADGCEVIDDPDVHLHFELKKSPTLEPPIDASCPIANHKGDRCIGYTPENPTQFGYYDPFTFLFEDQSFGL